MPEKKSPHGRNWPRFSNPPITEAILDLKVELPENTSLDQLAGFQDSIRDMYPGRRTRMAGKAEMAISEDKGIQLGEGSTIASLGYIFVSNDSSQMVQARKDGFTFNKLKPYDTWEALRDQAHKLWSHYVEIARPKYVSRIALRYVNRIEIPLPITDLSEYVLVAPSTPRTFPVEFHSFLMRMVMPYREYRAQAIVTETIEPGQPNSTTLPLIFDIDVFRQVSLEPDDKAIWEILDKLRDLKNEIFHSTMTDQAKALFK
ncbi:MAG: TIGR04255 family protein [Gemmatimonadetes bacterium]|nr:TIGR04255 family protein [Gemmatimonadota bacterium]